MKLYASRLSICLLAATVPASAQFYSFDPEGSLQTLPTGINPSGEITGYCYLTDFKPHGFIRDQQGNITTFDPTGSVGTYPRSIDPLGGIAGYYVTTTYPTLNAFYRDPQGNIVTLVVPGSTLDALTEADGISLSGNITGYYYDHSPTFYGYQGFVGNPGNIVLFAVGNNNYTIGVGINSSNAVTGFYADVNNVIHGFYRNPQGDPPTSFDPTGSINTTPTGINASGAIAGFYQDAAHVYHGFYRNPQGSNPKTGITSFDPPDSVATQVSGINDSNTVAGYWNNSSSPNHGFVRDNHGNITSFDPPGGTGSGGTQTSSISYGNVTTGTYEDADNVTHGFVGRAPNTIDISKYAGDVSDDVWPNAMQAGVSNVIVDAWQGFGPNKFANNQLLGAQTALMNTAAYILLNFYQDTNAGAGAAYQVSQAMTNIGAGLVMLKFLAIDVEKCEPCGEFVDWTPKTAYDEGSRITDSPGNHIQVVVTAGTSGSAPPTWKDNGGDTKDGGVVWHDTGHIFNKANTAANIAEIRAAVAAAQAYVPIIVIYTSKSGWQAITGNCDSTSCDDLIEMPLWSVGTGGFYGGDGVKHCGDGVAGLVPFTPYPATAPSTGSLWKTQMGHQYDLGPTCGGDTNILGLTGTATVDMDYFDPTLFR
jgi:hypothetical protein